MKISDYIVAFLEQNGITAVFELSGGMIAHLLDSLSKQSGVRVVSLHHEQGAAFAADGYARMTGRPGVALATSGPGAINLLTGVASCYFDSSPAVFITGQVNRQEQKGDRPIRQLGFQETDIVSMARPITKAVWRVTEAEQVPSLLEAAFRTAMEGRPGPVLLDVPMDVQRLQTVSVPKAVGKPTPFRLSQPTSRSGLRSPPNWKPRSAPSSWRVAECGRAGPSSCSASFRAGRACRSSIR
jgi:acetolactate synthase I/II/III large subunit